MLLKRGLKITVYLKINTWDELNSLRNFHFKTFLFYYILMNQSNPKPRKLQYDYKHNTDFYEYKLAKIFKFLKYIWGWYSSYLLKFAKKNFSTVLVLSKFSGDISKKKNLFLKLSKTHNLGLFMMCQFFFLMCQFWPLKIKESIDWWICQLHQKDLAK